MTGLSSLGWRRSADRVVEGDVSPCLKQPNKAAAVDIDRLSQHHRLGLAITVKGSAEKSVGVEMSGIDAAWHRIVARTGRARFGVVPTTNEGERSSKTAKCRAASGDAKFDGVKAGAAGSRRLNVAHATRFSEVDK